MNAINKATTAARTPMAMVAVEEIPEEAGVLLGPSEVTGAVLLMLDVA
jgi:hypothetical protein